MYNSFNAKEVIRALLALKASVNAKNDDGRTPLMFAAQYEKSEYFADLIGAGADVNAKDNDGWTPLMYAAFYCRSDDVIALLKAGADPSRKADDGKSAVLLAALHGNARSMKALLDAGATLDGKGLKNNTPLLLAAAGDDLESVELVLKSKPVLNGKNKDGDTALMLAADRGNPEAVAALLRAGADPALKDNDGQTAVDLAKGSKCDECAALLGDKWERRKPSGGTTLSVPCEPLGGAMDINVKTEEGDLVWSIFYPRPVGAYLGGFSLGEKKISAGVEIYVDADNNPKTGLPPTSGLSGDLGTGGAEYVIGLAEMGTTVQNESGKNVNRQVLDPSISKGSEQLTSDQMDGWSLKAERDINAVTMHVPMSVFGLKPGARIRVTARPGFCAPKSKVVTVG